MMCSLLTFRLRRPINMRALLDGSTTTFSVTAFLLGLVDFDLDLRVSFEGFFSFTGEAFEERLDDLLEEPELLEEPDRLDPERELELEPLEPELELPLLDFGILELC